MPTLPPMLRIMLMIAEALLFFSDGTPLYAAVLIGMNRKSRPSD